MYSVFQTLCTESGFSKRHVAAERLMYCHLCPLSLGASDF